MFHNVTRERPDVVWKIINEVINRTKVSPSIGELEIDGQVMSDESLAECFNTHFSFEQPTAFNPSALSYVRHNNDTFFLNPTDEIEICNIFLGLKNSKSSDVDQLQIKPAKYVIDIIAPCLAHIYNLALSSGQFPANMKLAKVSAIYKGGDKNVPNNYRPISVLPIFSKALEKTILPRLNLFFYKTFYTIGLSIWFSTR